MEVILDLIYYVCFQSLFHFMTIMALFIYLIDDSKEVRKKIFKFFDKHYLVRHLLIGLTFLSFINYCMIRFLNMEPIKPYHVLCFIFGWMTRRVFIWIDKTFSK